MYDLAEHEARWLSPPQESAQEYYKRLDDEERQREEEEDAYEAEMEAAIDAVQFYAKNLKDACKNLTYTDRYACCERCPFYKDDECILGNPYEWEA